MPPPRFGPSPSALQHRPHHPEPRPTRASRQPSPTPPTARYPARWPCLAAPDGTDQYLRDADDAARHSALGTRRHGSAAPQIGRPDIRCRSPGDVRTGNSNVIARVPDTDRPPPARLRAAVCAGRGCPSPSVWTNVGADTSTGNSVGLVAGLKIATLIGGTGRQALVRQRSGP